MCKPNWLGAINAVVWGENEGITLQKKKNGEYKIYIHDGQTAEGWLLTEEEVAAIKDACTVLLNHDESTNFN